ncbi:T9SS type A sorting domain-containing protein [Mesonia phycicola]|nr:T9SS type A sorting domain-containing protein [Mesonia phycicola]
MNSQVQIYSYDFENYLVGDYTTSIPEFNANNGDYFILTDEASISGDFTNVQGSYFFAAQDIDGQGASANQTLTFNNINVAGYTSLEFRVYLAEDDNGANENWDDPDYVHFSYDVDNSGSFTDILNIEATGGTNTAPAIDTNFDGFGNGTAITDAFTQYSISIPQTGVDLDLKVTFNLNSGDEDIAIDNIEVYGTPSVSPFIYNVTQTPMVGNVTSSDVVSVSADAIDSADGIAGVILKWGLVSGALTSSINMSLSSGNTYVADTSIPAQVGGSTVYYQIQATNGNVVPSTVSSAEFSYSVTDPLSLIISEVADPGDISNAKFLEIYNNGTLPIDFSTETIYVERYANGSTSPQSLQLTGTLNAGDYYVIAGNATDFSTAYGFSADLVSGAISGNGNDVYALYMNGDENTGVLLDIYGEIGVDGTGEAWEYEDSRAVRNSLTYSPSTVWIASEWTITAANANDMTPGRGEPTIYTYNSGWLPTTPIGNALPTDYVVIENGEVSLTADLEIFNLEVESAGILNVENVLKVNGNIVNNGELIFISNASTTGQLDEFYGSISGSSDITVQRYIPGGIRAFRFLTSAVTTSTSINDNWQEGVNNVGTNFATDNLNPNPAYGIHITGSTTGANGFDATVSGNPSLFGFNNTTQTWFDVANTNVNTFVAGEPYRVLVRGDRGINVTYNSAPATVTTLRAKGDLAYGSQSTSLSTVQDYFNLIGNPYQAIVDMTLVLARSVNLNINQYYVWDANLGTRGAYATVDLSTGVPVPSGSLANQYLQPGQAVFVSTLLGVASSITFEESDKATSESLVNVFRSSNTDSSLNIELQAQSAFLNNGSVADGVRVKFVANASNSIEANDASKLGNLDETLSIVNGNNYLSIETRDLPQTGEIIPLSIFQYREDSYVFKINLDNLGNVDAYLIDAYLGTQTLLDSTQENVINFNVDETISASVDERRFSIMFVESTLADNNFIENDFLLYPNPSTNGNFTIRLAKLETNKLTVNIFDVLGKQVYASPFLVTNNSVELNNVNLNSGVYLVQLEYNGKITTQKLIVE